MARYTGPKSKVARRFREPIFGKDKALEKKIDYIKALKIEETRLRKRLKQVAETRARVLRSI